VNVDSLPTSLLAPFPPENLGSDVASFATDRTQWYTWWLSEQLKTLPVAVLSVVVGQEPEPEGVWSPQLTQVFVEIARSTKSSESPSIHKLVEHITTLGLVTLVAGREDSLKAQSLVFAMLGWQTMLYRPALGICPPQQLAVTDEQDGYRGQAFITLKQTQMAAKRPLYEFLMGFGILLPPPNLCTAANNEAKGSFEEVARVEPSMFNMFLLESIGHIKITWVDVLSCHLEFDEQAGTVFLFRYPSFCLLNRSADEAEKSTRGVIHAAASPPSSSRQWASEEDVTKMLNETLLSYRLLFGQCKRSRKLFRAIDPFARVPKQSQDTSLEWLCGRKSLSPAMSLDEKDSYDLEQDFPILRSRIANLQRRLSTCKPRTWRELWQDKRNSAGWYTFWTVLIFGGLSLVLSFLQVVLQLVAIVLQPH